MSVFVGRVSVSSPVTSIFNYSLSLSLTCTWNQRDKTKFSGHRRRALAKLEIRFGSKLSDSHRFATLKRSSTSEEKRVSSATLKLEYCERRKWVFGTDEAFRYSWSNELDTRKVESILSIWRVSLNLSKATYITRGDKLSSLIELALTFIWEDIRNAKSKYEFNVFAINYIQNVAPGTITHELISKSNKLFASFQIIILNMT